MPYEQQTFEYGPRDYLNQLMALISSLRGGQQRYTPLLMAKIGESMPSMPMTGYSFPSMPGNSTIEESYDGSQTHSSGPESSDSTPFGSPPMSAAATFGFRNADVRLPPTSASFQAAMTGMQYADLTNAAPAQYFRDVALNGYPGSTLKYESDG